MHSKGIFMVCLKTKFAFAGFLIFVFLLIGQLLSTSCSLNKEYTFSKDADHVSGLMRSSNVSGGHLKRNFVTVFISFTLMTDPSYRQDNFNVLTSSQLQARMLDFVESVNYTLGHPYINAVYLLYNQDTVPAYAREMLGYHIKLRLVRLNDPYRFLNVFDYVHTNFRDQLVMISNADVYPDEGFEKLNYDLMKAKRLMYVPTRHGRKEKRCNMFPDQCDKVYRPPGAHDAYMFIPTSPIPEKGRPLLNKTWDTWGIENVILHVYQKMMDYKPINPCKAVFLYHNHCSKIRHNDRKRFDIAPQSKREYAMPTDKME